VSPGGPGKGPKNIFEKKFLKNFFLRRYVAEEGEFENGGREPRGPRERAQKILKKVFEKIFLRRYVAEEGEFENGGRDENISKRRERLSKMVKEMR